MSAGARPAGPPDREPRPRSPEAEAYARDVMALVRGCLDRLAATELPPEVEPLTSWEPVRAGTDGEGRRG